MEKQEKILQEMDRLAIMADKHGGWSAHIPYEAATQYDNGKVKKQFHAHVVACPYCQELLSTLGYSQATIKSKPENWWQKLFAKRFKTT